MENSDRPPPVAREATSKEDFDALIDLIATEGPHEAEFNPITELRDTEGKLDFAKIRSFFVQRHDPPDNAGDQEAVAAQTHEFVSGGSSSGVERASEAEVISL